jgi:hypothetical protein
LGGLRSLAFLSILRDLFRCPICALAIEFSPWHDGFSAACLSSIEAVSIQLPAGTRAETTSLLSLQAER